MPRKVTEAVTKAELRSQFLARRQALSAEEVARRSQAIANQFFTLPAINQRFNYEIEQSGHLFLHTFLPIARQNEVDTWPIIHRLWGDYQRVQVVASITNTVSNQLTHYALTPTTELVGNRWGIPEPVPTTEPTRPSVIDIVLVPLLAFDLQGHRVGYGKGYYDHFLADCRPDCLKVGLSLFDPISTISDIYPTDVRLNSCITPGNFYFFS